eukprot:SAG22_NODE_549_length_9239_cov_7.477899_11_plen_45_part_00
MELAEPEPAVELAEPEPIAMCDRLVNGALKMCYARSSQVINIVC